MKAGDQLLVVSAKDEQALNARIEGMREVLQHDNGQYADIADIGFTLATGRVAFDQRAALLVSPQGSPAARRDASTIRVERGVVQGAVEVAMMFPGQGNQFVGMGRQLYQLNSHFRQIVDECDSLASPLLGLGLRAFICGNNDDDGTRRDTLQQTSVAQPALFLVEYALAQVLRDLGVVPNVLIGHSIGEYAAACLAGVFELSDALRLVVKRGQLMQSMPSGSMLAVRAAPAVVHALIGTRPELAAVVSIAAHNSAELTVVSGPTSVLNELIHHFGAASIECRPLRTSHAFHSAMMDPILDAFAIEVAKTPTNAPTIPIISGLTGAILTSDQARSPQYWTQQLRHTVQFAWGIETICSQPGRLLLEVGPGTSLLTAAAKQRTLHQPLALIDTLGHPELDRPAADAVMRCLGRLWTLGVPLDFGKLYDAPARKLVRLPTYPFTRSYHWKSVAKSGPVEREGVPASTSTEVEPNPLAQSDERQSAVDPLWRELKRLLEGRLGRPLSVSDEQLSFVELGFDSLALTQLSGKVNIAFNVRIPFRRFYDDLSRPELLSAHLHSESRAVAVAFADTSEPIAGPAAMPTSADTEPTAAQREIWVGVSVGGQMANLAYNECRSVTFGGPLNFAELQLAFDTLIQRHEALRQTFSVDGASCITAAELRVAIASIDLRSLDVEAKRRELTAREIARVCEPFDLATGPLVRAELVCLDQDEHVFILCAHHIAVDGFSFGVLTRELGELYSARVEHRSPRLAPANSFAQYRAACPRHATNAADDTVTYWVTHLAGHSDLTLPTDVHRPLCRTYDSTRLDYTLEGGLVVELRKLAAASRVSTQTVFMSAFQLVLRALTGQHDIVLGVPTAGQASLGLDTLVGNWVNVLPVRAQLEDDMTFEAHVRRVNQTVLDALEHQHITFTELLPHLDRTRDPSRIPLIPVAFGMGRSVKHPVFSGVTAQLRVVPRTSESFELYVYLTEDGPSVEVSWSYNTGLFDADTIALWQRCFNATLENLVRHGRQQKLCQVVVLAHSDRERVLALAHGMQPPAEPFRSVSERIAAAALEYPKRVAVIDYQGEHTHQALNAQANQIARFLLTQQPEPGGLVAVCLERSVVLVASLLGVWRAGQGYVPLDPNYPTARIASILEDSRDPLVLTSRSLADRLPAHVRRILVEDFTTTVAELPTTPPTFSSRATDPAYVIFTSGSTGRPKGVVIQHRAFENFLTSMQREPGFEFTDCLLALTTVSFDIAGLELFLPLMTGGCLVLATSAQAVDPDALRHLLSRHRVTVVQATPSTWQMLLDSGWSGAPGLKALCGGEALSEHLAARLLEGGTDLWNLYGPTETTVWSSVKHVTSARSVTIGRPIANTTLYVLDGLGCLLPQGAVGELWIGGDGVALGYLGAQQFSAERFIESPFIAGERIYKTGDLARLRNEGDFECLGRSDFQVKLRGFRIELGEVESAILKYPDVVAAVVVLRQLAGGQDALVAYVVTKTGGLRLEALRSELCQQLPAYMLPSAVCVLDALPLTLNNKVDRNALPPPSTSSAYDVPDDQIRQPVHQHVWVRGFREAPLSAEELGPQTWLVLSDDAGIGQLVTEQLLRRGHIVTRVQSRDRFHEQSPEAFSVNPEVGREEFQRLIERLAELGRLPGHVLHLWLLPDDVQVRAGSTRYHRHQEHGLYTMLHLAGLLGPHALSNTIVHHVVGEFFGEARSDDQRARSTILGACRTIPTTLHQQQVRTVDMQQRANPRTKARLAARLVQELIRGDAATEVRYKRGLRQAVTWEPYHPLGQRNVKGAALVVGLTPYTLASVRSLSSKGVKVAVIVSQPINDELQLQLAELSAKRLPIEVFIVDAVREDNLRPILSQLRRALGPIRTLVLSVPTAGPVALRRWSEPLVEALVASEVSKLHALERLLPANELDLTVIHVSLDTGVGHPDTLVDSSLAAFLQLPLATTKGRRVFCNWAPFEAESVAPAVSQVSSDRQYFVNLGLTEAEVDAAHEVIWMSAGGTLAIVPFDVASYRRRLLTSSAKDVRAEANKPFIAPTSPTERRLCELWSEALGVAHLSIGDSFFDLGGHSLLAARLFAQVHKEFGVTLPLANLIETPTIAGLARTIDAAIDRTHGPAAINATWSSLVRLNEGTDPTLPPFFVVGGATGNVLNLRHLARICDPQRDFYGIQARGLSGEAEPDLSLVAAAAAFVTEIRRVQPHGPYYLGGFCIGGVTALEMARTLREDGEEVAQLIMLDSHVPEVRGTLNAGDRLQIQLERLREGGLQYVYQWVGEKYRYVGQKARRRLGLQSTSTAPEAYRSEPVLDAMWVARANYQPASYPGHIVVFRPPLAPHHTLSGGRLVNRARGFLLDDNGWGRIASSLEVHELTCPPGDHDGFVLEPYVRDLARRLSPFLLHRDP